MTIPNKLDAIILNIRAQRELKGFTQMDVADQLKISQSAYCRIELGHTKIVVNTLLDIAEILNVKASALINIVNESTCLVKTDLTISIHHISNFV